MKVMDLVAQARPASLDPPPASARRASDLAAAIAAVRPGWQRPGNGTGTRRRAARPPRPGHAIAAAAAALAAAAAVSLVHGVASHARHVMPASRPLFPQTGGAAATSVSLQTVMLGAFRAVSGDILYTQVTDSGPHGGSVTDEWVYPSQPGVGQQVSVRLDLVHASMSAVELTYWQPGGAEDPAGIAQAYGHRAERIEVEYGSRTWTDQVIVAGAAAPGMDLPDLFRMAIASADNTAAVKTELGGRAVFKLPVGGRGKGAAVEVATLWVDAVTGLPVQLVTQGAGHVREAGFAFLAPTAANLARLNLAPPAGFTRVPAPELPANIRSFDGPVT